MSEPLVSVVIPTYDAVALLMETLQSVQAQTFTDFEIVVINDGSTDDTATRLADLAARESRLRVISQENQGVGAARNRGIDEARGRYVALVDHDDLWLPKKLETQIDFARRHPDCSIILVPWSMTTATDHWMFSPEIAGPDGIVDRPLLAESRGNSLICSSAMLFEKSRAAGLRYGERRQCIEDQEFHIGLVSRGKVGVAGRDVLMHYRAHGANTSSDARYWYNGVRHLRALDREGQFAGLEGDSRQDMHAFLAHMARTAVASQLLNGHRLRALNLYFGELRYQINQRRWSFLAGMPVLACSPRSLIRRAFSQERPR